MKTLKILKQRPKKHLSDEDYEPDHLQTRHQKNRSRHSVRISNKGFCVRYKEVRGELQGYQVTCSDNVALIDNTHVTDSEDNDVDHDYFTTNVDTINILNKDKKDCHRGEWLFQSKLEDLEEPDMQQSYSSAVIKKHCKLPTWGDKRLRIYPQRQRQKTDTKSHVRCLSINMHSWSASFKSSRDKGHHKPMPLSQSLFSDLEQLMTNHMQKKLQHNTQSYEEMKLPDWLVGREHDHTTENSVEFQEHLSTKNGTFSAAESQDKGITNPKVFGSLQNVPIDVRLPSTSSGKSATIEKLNNTATDGIRNSRTSLETLSEIECSMNAATDDDKAPESLDEFGERKNRRINTNGTHHVKRKKHRPRVKRDINTRKSKGKQKGKEKKGRLEGNSSRGDEKKTPTTECTILAISFSVRKKRTFRTRPRSIRKGAENTVLQAKEMVGTILRLCHSMTQLSISTARETLAQQDRGPKSPKCGFCDLEKQHGKAHQSLMDVSVTNPREDCSILLPNYTAEFIDSNKLDLDTMLAIVPVPTSISNHLTFQNETGDPCSMHATVPSYRITNKGAIVQKHSTRTLLAQEADSSLQVVIYNQKREMILAKSAKASTKPRAKVQMDSENERIWPRLALGGIPLEFEDHQYWEKERAIMKKRIELFIQRMQVVQGHRRFSPWKGSIVDSVVGAFLTQNVSDHLSSSAFMSVASRYPAIKRKDVGHAHLQEMITPSYDIQQDTEKLQTGQTSLSKEDSFIANDCANLTTENVFHNEGVMQQMHNEEPKTELSEDPQRNSNTFFSTDSDKFGQDLSPVKEYMDLPEVSSIPNGNLLPTDLTASSHHKKIGLSNASLLLADPLTEKADQIMCRTVEISISMQTGEEKHLSESNHELELDEKHQSGVVGCGLFNDRNRCAMKDGEMETNTVMHIGPGDIKDYCTDVEDMIEEGWKTSCQRSEVYSKSYVRRSLFKFTDIREHVHSKKPLNHNHPSESDGLIQETYQDQSELFRNNNIQHEEPIREEREKMAAFEKGPILANGSQIFNNQFQEPETVAHNRRASPSLLGKRRVPLITGMERAHFEENQNGRKKNHKQDWEPMRKQTLGLHDDIEDACKQSSREDIHQDLVDWEAVHGAKVEDLADTIKERGMHHVLSGRIKAFLKTVHHEHGCIDLEWLRKITPKDAKAYLMSIHGLGVKSVECIRLLTLHHVAFPVDVNVGRICVRLGWVPIEPLPEELQLHLLEMYPVQETIQKYLWPRLCTLDQETLYEFHYQLITFGKVFCTKSKPNCNACPLKTECKHFASAYASAKPLLTAPNNSEDRDTDLALDVIQSNACGNMLTHSAQGRYLEQNLCNELSISEVSCNTMSSHSDNHVFFVDEPASPDRIYEPEVADMEDFSFIYDNLDDFTDDLLKAGNITRANANSKTDNVSFTHGTDKQGQPVFHPSVHPEANHFNTNTFLHEQTNEKRLMNTEKLENLIIYNCSHQAMQVDSPTPQLHSSFQDGENYGPEDLNATRKASGGTKALNAIIPLPSRAHLSAPKLKNISRLRTVHYVYELPDNHYLLEKFPARERDDPSPYLLAIWGPETLSAEETVPGTLLIPCRTAMNGSFPLNGTYFQVNEVFADHESSLHPLQVHRSAIWSLQRRFVYFGSSVTNISRGLSTEEIRSFFLHGYVCVRGFECKTRSPKPLICRLHFPASKQTKNKKAEKAAV